MKYSDYYNRKKRFFYCDDLKKAKWLNSLNGYVLTEISENYLFKFEKSDCKFKYAIGYKEENINGWEFICKSGKQYYYKNADMDAKYPSFDFRKKILKNDILSTVFFLTGIFSAGVFAYYAIYLFYLLQFHKTWGALLKQNEWYFPIICIACFIMASLCLPMACKGIVESLKLKKITKERL